MKLRAMAIAKLSFAGAGSADQNGIALVGDESAAAPEIQREAQAAARVVERDCCCSTGDAERRRRTQAEDQRRRQRQKDQHPAANDGVTPSPTASNDAGDVAHPSTAGIEPG